MAEQPTVESILATDIGSTSTHACLIDQVEGSYRLVAQAQVPTTITPPEADATIGLRRAIQRIERITQRVLLNDDDDLITPERVTGEGVDGVVITSNAAEPLRCAVIGLTDDLSLDSARRACITNHATVELAVALGRRQQRWNNETLSRLRGLPPDIILLVGGIDNGPTEALESAARVLATVYEDLDTESRPLVIFAGNQEARRPVGDILDGRFDFRVVDNVRPSVGVETTAELQRELAQVYANTKLTLLPGYRRLRRWSTFPLMSTAEAYGRTLRFVARRNALSQGIMGIDLGGSTTMIGAAKGDVYQWVLDTWVGTGYGIKGVLERSTTEEIARWLPVALPASEIDNRLQNELLRPHSIPQSMEDLFLVHAVMRQSLLLAMRSMRQQHWLPIDNDKLALTPPFDLIAVRGGALAHTPQDGLLALTLLDSLQPVGLTHLVLDWASIWPQLGALAQTVPLAAAQVLERDGFRELGPLIAPIGEARDGEKALNLRIHYDDGTTTDEDIPAGTVRRFPLSLHQEATVEVRPSRAFDIGLGRRGMGGKSVVRGGSLGIIVDTRGRPLGLPQDPERCRAKIQEWLGNLIHDADDAL